MCKNIEQIMSKWWLLQVNIEYDSSGIHMQLQLVNKIAEHGRQT